VRRAEGGELRAESELIRAIGSVPSAPSSLSLAQTQKNALRNPQGVSN